MFSANFFSSSCQDPKKIVVIEVDLKELFWKTKERFRGRERHTKQVEWDLEYIRELVDFEMKNLNNGKEFVEGKVLRYI